MKTPGHRRPLALSLAAVVASLAACGDSQPSSTSSPSSPSSTGPRPNIIVVTFDTTRADHLSCYGYEKKTTPALDALAADGVRYERAYAVTSWTLPSHASIFTGKFPSAHGAHYDPEGAINLVMDGGIKGNPAWDQYRANPLSPDEVTLAELLTDHGYATAGIIGGPWLKKVFGLGEGFELYDDSNFELGRDGSELNGRTAEDITRAAIEFIDDHEDEPFFLFLNYYDPHSPYAVRREYIRRFWSGPLPPAQDSWEWRLAQYDAEIRYTDDQFGVLLEHLKSTGLYEDAWIIMTADHGELMGDNDMSGHGDSLTEPEINIPLIVKWPGADRRRGVDDTLVQQIDIMPTVLDHLGIPHPPNMQGRSLTENAHPIVAEVYPLPFMNARQLPWQQIGDWKVLIHGKHKFVWGSEGRHQLFDLEADPAERTDLYDAEPEIAARMEAQLKAYFESLPEPGEVGDVVVDEETLRELQKMGYIGGDHK